MRSTLRAGFHLYLCDWFKSTRMDLQVVLNDAPRAFRISSQLWDWMMNSALEENHMHGGKMWRPGIILMAAVIGEGVHCSWMTSSSPPPLEESELMNVIKRSVCCLLKLWGALGQHVAHNSQSPAWILLAHLWESKTIVKIDKHTFLQWVWHLVFWKAFFCPLYCIISRGC